MRIRIVDYVLTAGGGARFLVQLIGALEAADAGVSLEFVSHGDAFAWFKERFAEYGLRCALRDIAPETPSGYSGLTVGAEALQDCDVAWFPWVHHHRFRAATVPIVGSFHDALIFTEPTLLSRFPDLARDERETIGLWLASSAALACSSQFSRATLAGVFGCPETRLQVIPLAGRHADALSSGPADFDPPWMNQPFLLCPANVSRHKNHEVLLEGFARADLGWPLVLTGVGTDLKDDNGGTRHPFLRSLAVALGRRPPTRAATLRRLIRQLHLELGTSLLPVGYLSDSSYDLVLGRAAAVVLATLGEGGGSFPAEEAVLRGIPAICSVIPVLREHMARLGASVQWFDPTNPTALASRLVDLRDNYAERKAAAIAQVPGLTPRAWNQVALDYLAMFRNAGSARGPAR